MLAISGYNITDVVETVFTVYQNEVGNFILKTMIGKTLTKVFTEFSNYYKIGNLVYNIVKRTVN